MIKKQAYRHLRIMGIVLFLLCSFGTKAGHIVGGYITYTCLGNNQYVIKMRIYRDSLGTSTPYPVPANLDIVDKTTNTLFQTLPMVKGPTRLIPIDTSIGCTTAIPPTILIQFADYIDTVTIPPSPQGYDLSFTVCCRNAVIGNITNPQSIPSTFKTSIAPNDTSCNSSPSFTENPPIVLCYDRPINLPIPVTEADGDSLHYEICQLHRSTTQTIPYNFLIPASPTVSIDPVTGVLQGTPNQIGQYVLGICVQEFRNGNLLSTVQLDYQFNVANCISVYSDILTQFEDSLNACNGLSVTFTDESQNASSVFWDFGDTTSLTDTSSLRNPSYTYPGPGSYLVQLIASKGDTCTDTTSSVFVIQEKDSISFRYTGTYCYSNNSVAFVPEVNLSDTAKFKWSFGPTASPGTWMRENPPPVSWSSSGKHYVELEVTDGLCKYLFGDTINIKPEVKSDMLLPSEDPSIVCNGLEVNFISESTNATSILWDFGDNSTLADTSSLDSTAYLYPRAGTYKVQLIAFNNNCSDTSTFNFPVHEGLAPDILIAGDSCFEGQNLYFEAVGSYPATSEFTWNFGQQSSYPVKKGRQAIGIFWVKPGIYPIELTVNTEYCSETVFDTVGIRALTLNVDAGDTQYVDEGEPVWLSASAGADYYWSADRPVLFESPFSQTTEVDMFIANQEDTIVKFYVVVTDGRGCQGIDSTYVIINRSDAELAYNFISPNEDGLNDYLDLSPLMRGRQAELHVLNRWGSEVYMAEDYKNDWTGVDNDGNPLPDGTYYFILHYESGEKYKGPVSIIRSQN